MQWLAHCLMAVLSLDPLPHNNSSTPRDLIKRPSIHSNNLPIDIHILRQKNHRLRHLLIAPRPLRRRMPLLLHPLMRHLRLVILAALLHRQFRREVSGRYAIDTDLGLLELRAHHFGKMDGGAFGSVVLQGLGVSISQWGQELDLRRRVLRVCVAKTCLRAREMPKGGI